MRSARHCLARPTRWEPDGHMKTSTLVQDGLSCMRHTIAALVSSHTSFTTAYIS